MSRRILSRFPGCKIPLRDTCKVVEDRKLILHIERYVKILYILSIICELVIRSPQHNDVTIFQSNNATSVIHRFHTCGKIEN